MKMCGRGWHRIGYVALGGARDPAGGQVVSWRGQPQAIRLDKGPEFIAEQFITWCTERAIQLSHVYPGKSDQNILG